MGELGFCFLLILIVLFPIVPTIIALTQYKKKTQKEFERTDKDKHRYYPIIFSKSARVAIFFVLISMFLFVLPCFPIIMIHLLFPEVKIWIVIAAVEFLGLLCIFIYYRFLVFDIDFVELDKKSFEIVHKNGKRDLYSLATYVSSYENTFHTKYAKGVTRGLIFEIAGKKKEVNLDFLGDEGFVIFNGDLQALLKNGELPVVSEKTIEEKPSAEKTDKKEVSQADVKAPDNNLLGYDFYIFIKNSTKAAIDAALKEYDEIYTSDSVFKYVTGDVPETAWNYAELILENKVDEDALILEYFNILLWLKDKSKILFAFAFPNDYLHAPIYAVCDLKNPMGDTCHGIMNKKEFNYNVPEMAFEWGKELPEKYDYNAMLKEEFAFKKEWFDIIVRNSISQTAGQEKASSSEVEWRMRITDYEFTVNSYEEFQGSLDEALTTVEMGHEEFLVVEPSIPQKGIAFMQVCAERNSDKMHIEAGLNKKDEKGYPFILCKDDVTVGECLDLFSDFYEGWNVDTTGWYKLQSPD